LQRFTNGKDIVEGSEGTVEHLLTQLVQNDVEIGKRLFRDGKLSRSVMVFVNDENVRFLNDLQTPVVTGDEVSIVNAYAGG